MSEPTKHTHEEIWLLARSGKGNPESNMRMDAWLLSTAGDRPPLLRFYGWTEPAASYGYFQRADRVASMTQLRPLVRRPTGGGLVPHDADWTYSLSFPPLHWWYALSAKESYQLVHEWVSEAFSQLGVRTELSPSCATDEPGKCFAGAVASDVLRNGRKIAGAAQRRSRDGLLIQGSVQSDGIPTARNEWERAMLDVAIARWKIQWDPVDLKPEINSTAKDARQLP